MANEGPPPADVTTLRLTMILSGAISLGAYEAGVVSQIAYALDKWNQARLDKPPLAIIDLISGASAGAMTGAMLASHIMQGGDPVEFVRANRDSWCGPQLSFDNETKVEPGDVHSFLSSRRIDEVADQTFLPAQQDLNRVRQKELIYTCTVTSLNPIPFQYQAATSNQKDGQYQEETFLGNTQRDWVTFSIARDEADPIKELPTGGTRNTTPANHNATWDRLKWFALASGAFPLAWQPITISRHYEDYPVPWSAGKQDFVLSYSDGGILDNLPLDRASEALECMQELQPDAPRTYVIIQPDPTEPNPPANVQPFTQSGKRDGDMPVVKALGAVYDALREQSFDKDLLNSQKVNRRLKAREQFIPPLIATLCLAPPPDQVQAATEAARQQLDDYLDAKGSPKSAEEEVARYRARLRTESAIKLTLEGLPVERQYLFLCYMALIDHIAGLDDKSTIRIGRIFPPGGEELAGKKLGHFGGFLSSEFTLNDFICGLRDAHVWLTDLASQERLPETANTSRQSWPAPASVLDDLTDMLNLTLTDEQKKLATTPWAQLPGPLKEHFTDLIINRAADFVGDEVHAGTVGRLTLRGIAHLVDGFIRFPAH